MKSFSVFLFLMIATMSNAQNSTVDSLIYHKIPECTSDYGSGNVVARFIDGLGFRYHWATKGLTSSDLEYSPSEHARSTLETIDHILSLSQTILNGAKNEVNIRPKEQPELSFEEMRNQTLANLKMASELLKGKTKEELNQLKVKFEFNGKSSEYPFWNMMNGPIADAIYHTGQIVSFRRTSGNPMNPKVNVFLGEIRF